MPVSPTMVFRNVKGTPLTNAEVDNNFTVLRDFANASEARVNIALNDDGTVKAPVVVAGTSATGTDDYVTTLSGFTPASEADLANKIILVKPTDNSNDSLPTLKVLPLTTPRNIVRVGGVACAVGDIRVNKTAMFLWDGTNNRFELLNPCTEGQENYYADSGAVNAYVVATSPTLPFSEPVAYFEGYTVTVKIATTNTGASTLKVGALAAVAIQVGTAALVKGQLAAGQVYKFVHDGTVWQLVGGITTTQSILSASTMATTAITFSHGLGVKPTSWGVKLQCIATDAGYAVGDEIDPQAVYFLTGGVYRIHITTYANASVIGISHDAQINAVTGKTGTAEQTFTTSKWKPRAWWSTQ